MAERLKGLRAEIEAFGFALDIEPTHEGKIYSAFIKAMTKIHLIRVEAPKAVAGAVASNRLVKVKVEIDTDPPAGIRTETKTLLEPFPVSIRVVTSPCLFGTTSSSSSPVTFRSTCPISKHGYGRAGGRCR